MHPGLAPAASRGDDGATRAKATALETWLAADVRARMVDFGNESGSQSVSEWSTVTAVGGRVWLVGAGLARLKTD